MTINHLANPLKSQRATRWTLLVIAWVAFMLRTVTLATQSLWRDEVDAIIFSGWKVQDLVAGMFKAGHNGPLFFMLLRPWRNLTGTSEFALRYPSALLGTLAVPLGYVLARQLGFNRRAGVLLGLLLATSPYLIWYGQEAKMYAMLIVLVTLAVISYFKALTGAGVRWWVVFTVATSLSFYTHILAPLMLMVYGVVAFLYRAHLRREWRGWLISMSCLTIPYLPLMLWQLDFLVEGYPSGHPFYPLQEELYLLLQLYSSGLIRFTRWTPIVLFIFLFLCGFLLGWQPSAGRSSMTRSRYVLAVWALLPPMVVYLISLRIHVFEDRYLIYVAPALYLLIVTGLLAVRQYWRWLAGFCLGLILAFNLMGTWQQQQPIKADFRSAAQYLSSQPQPPSSIMVQIPYLKHTLDYYYPGQYSLLEGLWTNDNKSEAAVHQEMIDLVAGLDEVWLVVSEEDMWDSRHLTRAWLNEHAKLVDEAHFNRVGLYYYQFRSDPIHMQGIDGAAE